MHQSLSLMATPGAGSVSTGEYLLVVQMENEVCDKILGEKESFNARYSQKKSSENWPHITVANFMAREEMEETLIRWIERISSQLKSFAVTLNNYSGIPEHSIYIRVQDHQPFKQLAAQLKAIDPYIRMNGFPAVQLVSHPHLSIGRCLSKEVYGEAVIEYSEKMFCESFIAGELLLVRRDSQYEDFKVINKFRLRPPDTYSGN